MSNLEKKRRKVSGHKKFIDITSNVLLIIGILGLVYESYLILNNYNNTKISFVLCSVVVALYIILSVSEKALDSNVYELYSLEYKLRY